MKRWPRSAWAQKLMAKAKFAIMTDFARFRVMVARKKRAKAVKEVRKITKK